MNTASDPYSTALLITMSIPSSRYFRIAMAMAIHRQSNARLTSSPRISTSVRNHGMIVTITSSAAAANHFSCSRSSPDDRANLATTAATPTANAAIMRTNAALTSGGFADWVYDTNGCRQMRVAYTIRSAMASAYAPATDHAATRHRGERSCPVGKSRNTKASTANRTGQIQLASQAAARPAGQDPGTAARACCAYWVGKKFSPTARPATRNSQPRRLAGRLVARTNPTAGTARLVTYPKTSEKSQLVRFPCTRYRSTYASTTVPAMSAADAAAAEPATQRTVRALICTPSSGPTPLPAVSPQPTAADKEGHPYGSGGEGGRPAHPFGCLLPNRGRRGETM